MSKDEKDEFIKQLVDALTELDAALDYGLCESGSPDFDYLRLARAQDDAKFVLSSMSLPSPIPNPLITTG